MKRINAKTIETERLILRLIAPEDAHDMYNGWAGDEETTRYMSWKTHPDIETTKKYILYALEKFERGGFCGWIIKFKENGDAVGYVEISNVKEDIGSANAGCCIAKKYRSYGFATEALSAVFKYMFEEVGANRIEGLHLPENKASGKLMQRCGMKFEGTRREAARDNKGNISDIVVYSIIKSDYYGRKNEIQ